MFYADLHVHSRFSRATSRDCDLEHLALWAGKKGIAVVATGDFTHPGWFEEIQAKLTPAEPGLFRLRPEREEEVRRQSTRPGAEAVRFMLQVEISTIYKRGGRTRKVHHLVYAPDLESARRLSQALGRIGNLASDGRPILGLDSRDLLEIVLQSGEGCCLVPAHVWTPWFAVLGSKSGFDSVEECYADMAAEVFALETGLSSDPAMNWRVSGLDRYALVSNSDAHSPSKLGREACVFQTDVDYFAMFRALRTGEGYRGTVEFFPEEGKYHLDGHRKCGVCLTPEETRRHAGNCPQCGKPLTLGVMYRVCELADRPAPPDPLPPRAAPFRSLIPLDEVLAEIHRVGRQSNTVRQKYEELLARLGPELFILGNAPLEDLARAGSPLVAEAIARMRQGRVICQAGYDGEYGVIRLFTTEELLRGSTVGLLFAMPEEPRAEKHAENGSELFSAGIACGKNAHVREISSDPFSGSFSGGGILDRLDADQRAAAEAIDGPVLIVAGPGTGKTRTLTHRLAHLIAAHGAAPEQCLALTFSRRAAGEMIDRLERLLPEVARRVPVMTFHALGLSILREHGDRLGLSGRPTTTPLSPCGRGVGGEGAARAEHEATFRRPRSTDVRIISTSSFTNPPHPGPLPPGEREVAFRPAPSPPLRVAAEAERAEMLAGLLSLSPHAASQLLGRISRRKRGQDYFPPPAVDPSGKAGEAEALAVYERELRARGWVDFDDLILLPLRLLKADPDLVGHYRARYRWVSVDEYQDIDAAQYELVRLLVPSDGNLCAIGDPDQAIYGFRGADVGYFQRFCEDFPTARTIRLSRNYRSTQTIVDAALQLIAPASLVADRELLAQARGPEQIEIHACATDRAEAELVVQTVERILGGSTFFSLDSDRASGHEGEGEPLSFGDFAVLYRTEAQAEVLAEALARSGMPFQTRSHGPLADQPAVQTLIRAMAEAPAAGAACSVAELLDQAAGKLGERDPHTQASLVAMRSLALRHGSDLAQFLSELALGVDVDLWDPRAQRISLLTLHAAKGLEFPVVFLVGCEDGLLPLHWGSADEQSLAEERRLFFVGMTRAQQRLILTHARKRLWRGSVREQSPSPFLDDIEQRLLAVQQHRALKRPALLERQRTLFDG